MAGESLVLDGDIAVASAQGGRSTGCGTIATARIGQVGLAVSAATRWGIAPIGPLVPGMLGHVTLPPRFFPSFMAVLDDFGARGFFTEAAGDECDGSPVDWSEPAVRSALARSVGYLDWPFAGDSASEVSVVLNRPGLLGGS